MSAWTEDRIEQLKRLWLLGRSAGPIAGELGGGLTRNAVLSKVRRLGLSASRPATRCAAGERPARGRSPAHVAPPTGGSATIQSLRRGDCRWPYGSPGDPAFRLCGRPAVRGAFCEAHAAIAYRPVPQSVEGLMRLAGIVP